jgi:hypothetical protein
MKALDGEKVHATSRNVLFFSVERNRLLANMCLSVDCIVHLIHLFVVGELATTLVLLDAFEHFLLEDGECLCRLT